MTRVALVNKDNGAEPVIGELLILPQFILCSFIDFRTQGG